MTEAQPKKAIIAGAGIGGLAAAAALSRVGFEVEVYERADEIRPVGSGLSLMCNAMHALHELGIELDLDDRAVRFDSLRLLTTRGRPIRTLRFGEIAARVGQPNFAVHRATLHQALYEQAHDCKVVLGARCTGYQVDGDGVRLDLADGSHARGDVLIGADGFNSVVRKQLVGVEEPVPAGYICWRATPTFAHPKVTPGYVAHYWGRGQRFGLADIGNGQVYWWGTKNMSPVQAREWRGGKAGIAATFRGWAEEVGMVIEATPEDSIISLSEQDRPFLENWGKGPVTLLGDAAHPMLSSMGQGAAIAIEDGMVLADSLASAEDVETGLRTYEDRRRPRARAMVAASRGLSRVEQLENPIQALGRDLYFRFAAESTFTKKNELALVLEGVRQ